MAYVRKLEIENCGCIRKASFTLTPLHALVGPNDSGKSTTLATLRTATQFAASEFTRAEAGELLPFTPILDDKTPGRAIRFEYDHGLGYAVGSAEGAGLWDMALGKVRGVGAVDGPRQSRALLGKAALFYAAPDTLHSDQLLKTLRQHLTTSTLVRLDPDALRAPAPLIPRANRIRFEDDRGKGLASVYDAILNRDRKAFDAIEAAVRKAFPTVDHITLENAGTTMKEPAAILKGGTQVSAKEMSEGLLYFLGFSALQYCEGPTIFLVEEPENGLHPSRIQDVMRILRVISETSQVILATHSPLVVNELRPDEVTVVTRDEKGTHARLIKDTPEFEERSKVYALGELWVSYANGVDEAPLLQGGARG
jgi:predicted ATPase